MDYELIKNNLKFNIDKIKSLIDSEDNNNIIDRFVLDIAKYNNYDVIGIEDSFYIKKGIFPKAILHLNVDTNCFGRNFSYKDSEDGQIYYGKNLSIVDAALVISVMLERSTRDFDVLITKNNIQRDTKTYVGLRDIMRSDNIINLNLRKAKCLADEFSALILSNVRVPIERIDSSYEYKTFRLSLNNLIGGHTSEDLDKVRLNSIKTIIGLIRRIKSKVDLDVINFVGGDRYDSIPNYAYVDFMINKDYESALFDIFSLFKNEYIEKNLKYEPDMDLTIEDVEFENPYPISDLSFSHLASFIELMPTGAFAVNPTNNQLISSINLSTARTNEDTISFIVVYRSLEEDSMNEMLEKAHTAAKISSSEIISRLQIPRWRNYDDGLTNAFRASYQLINEEELNVIKTQYSLDSSIIFSQLNVKMVSLGVEYKQGEDGLYYTNISEIISVVNLIDDVLAHL